MAVRLSIPQTQRRYSSECPGSFWSYQHKADYHFSRLNNNNISGVDFHTWIGRKIGNKTKVSFLFSHKHINHFSASTSSPNAQL